MVCKKCAQEINDGLQFCPKCGCETGYKPKNVNNGKTLGILSIVFSFDLTLIGLILGIIGLIKGIKAKDKISIILNAIGIVVSVLFTIIYAVQIVRFIKSFTSMFQMA